MVNWNGFPSIFQKVQYFHSRHWKTTSHILRISLNGILKLNEVWPLEGAMYISLWENSRGHPDNVSFMQFSTKIDGFEKKDSQGSENSYNSYEQYPLEKFFIFTIYQNYTFALMTHGHIGHFTCMLHFMLHSFLYFHVSIICVFILQCSYISFHFI